MSTFSVVNDKGMKAIHEFLAKHHRLGGDYFGPSELAAWAEDVEFQLAEGNPPTFELKSYETLSGHTEEFTLSDDCIDREEGPQ